MLALLVTAHTVSAQIAMPDPKEMSGIPRPVGVNELPNGSVSVRVIRGALTNNIANQPVDMRCGDKALTAKTDEAGRAQFDKLQAGASCQAVTTVDGERIESQSFPAPASGGIRIMLVATDKAKEAAASAAAALPAVTGTVVLGEETRIVLEPGDEKIDVYYFIDIMNGAATPVNTASFFAVDLPSGAGGATLFKESSPLAAMNGTHLRVNGPFPPGKTSVQLAYTLPVMSGTLEIRQVFPAAWEQPLFIMKKFGNTKLGSPQFIGQQDMPESGIVMAGSNRLEAGQPLIVTLSDLPHHSTLPRYITVTVASLIVLAGLWAGLRPAKAGQANAGKDERKRLTARREKLFQELVKVEQDRQSGRGDPTRLAARREELVASLERVYGALDTDEASSGPSATGRAGVVA